MDDVSGATDGGQTQTDPRLDEPRLGRGGRRLRPGTKQFTVLAALARGRSFNRFEAERDLNDHCLHSTVSIIERLGISVCRRREKVPCLGGQRETHVKRYWLEPMERDRALTLLGI